MKIGEVRYEYTCIKWKPPSKANPVKTELEKSHHCSCNYFWTK